MKILWIVNVPLPEVSILMGEKPSPFGGWLVTSSQRMAKLKDIELHVAFPYSTKIDYIKGEKITYHSFRSSKFTKKEITKIDIDSIIRQVSPDLIHIYGTEMNHSYQTFKLLKTLDIPYVISIQGLTSYIPYHYSSNLPDKIKSRKSIRNFLFRDNIKNMEKEFYYRGLLEKEMIKNSTHIIGRTEWDKAGVKLINPKINYYHNNEVLRESFYNNKWDYNKCEKHSIFVSQASYPLKGFHSLIEAMPFILKKYPEAKVYVSGQNPTDSKTIKGKLKLHYYGIYLKKIIRKLNLEENIIFLGPLSEEEILNRYLKSNVFVSPSSIENSPNSVGEAMILGVPVISSYVGGVMDMLKHKKEGFLYQFDAPYMLAHYVIDIFSNEENIVEITNNARIRANNTHDIEKNINELLNIYEIILK